MTKKVQTGDRETHHVLEMIALSNKLVSVEFVDQGYAKILLS